ncbi:MAG: hypothetical protein PHW69_05515 [Elusimicrobiaceae bacterium]|nr:hypothetical protein [Elusimicrobiaceae bacterium]
MKKLSRLFLVCLLTAEMCVPVSAQGFAPLNNGSLHLIDAARHDSIFPQTEQKESAPDEEDLRSLSDRIRETSPFKYSQDKWNDARYAAENGLLQEDRQLSSEYAELTGAQEVPKALPPSLQMPDYGTSLSVTGRKVIGFAYSSKKYLSPQVTSSRASGVSSFDLTQEMQVRMQGKIGPRITVNVDYDDTKQDKQDISIIYKGDTQDVVQSASFGDIDMTLPSSEFVSYSKQLFGIRTDIKYKGLKATVIGSRTKGTTKTKQFVGNTVFSSVNILDTAYRRRTYYDLSFGSATARLPIKQGTEKVYLDNQNYVTANGVNVFEKTADDMGVQTSSYTGKFRLLSAGVDYVMDYTNGLIQFRNALDSQDVVAIDFTNANGTQLAYNSPADPLGTNGTGNIKLIKTKNDILINTTTEKGYQCELKTYYSIGQTQIVRDDGKGNFILRVNDSNGSEVGSTLNPKQTYSDTISVDFELGIFHLAKPFASPDDPNTPDPYIYAATPVSKRTLHIEYSSRVKTFTLEPSIVTQSESVIVDGAKYTRNLDYYIDYDSGFITFYNESRINSTSVIQITYDVSQFGGLGTSALLGGRVSYDLGSKLSVGSSLLYQTASKAKTAPDISDIASSMLVYEGDTQLKNVRLLGVNSSFGAEAAQSRSNPNLNGLAIVENMEGVKEETTASLDAISWRIAANPIYAPALPSAVSWLNTTVKTLEINPHASATADDTQTVLVINYDLSVSSEASIVYPFDLSGLDFSSKKILRMVVRGDGSAAVPGPSVNLHFGQINEDSDGSGGMTLTCANGTTLVNAPKTEDLNCNGQLAVGEDIGWNYNPASGVSTRYGATNGIIDTQDLNGNGILDAQDFTGGDFGYVNGTLFTDMSNNTQTNSINFTGWRTLQAGFSIVSTDTYKWTAVKQVRISLQRAPGGKTKGQIILAQLEAEGNTWTVNASTPSSASLSVAGINNEDNPEYSPIFSAGGEAQQVYNDLYGSVEDQQQLTNSENVIEQSLNLIYTSTGPAVMSADRRFTNSIDISAHKLFSFLLNNPPGNEVSTTTLVFLRIGTDSAYKQVQIPLGFTGWRQYKLELTDSNGDGVADDWQNACNYEMTLTSSGTASFASIGIIRAGIMTTDMQAHSGSVWLDELFVGEPRTLVGNAKKLQADFQVPGWGEFGGKYKSMDRNFQTPVSVNTKQDSAETTAYMRLRRISVLPMEATYSDKKVVTPYTVTSDDSSNLVSLISQGEVTTKNGTAKATLAVPKLPQVDMSYSFTKANYASLGRDDDYKIYSAAMKYSVPLKTAALPRSIDARYSRANNDTVYNNLSLISTSSYYTAYEKVDDMSLGLMFAPWKGAAFNPSYALKQSKETRPGAGAGDTAVSYNKSLTQTAGFTGNFPLLAWFNPTASYSVNTIENANLTVSTITVGANSQAFSVGQIKTVNRTANGGLNINLSGAQVVPSWAALKTLTLTAGYQLQDGDTWTGVDNNMDTKTMLWIRIPLKTASIYTARTNLTLRDTVTSTQRWSPLSTVSFGKTLAPLKTLALSNTFSYAVERKEITGTYTKTVTKNLPNILATLNQLETLTGTSRWISSAIGNVKYSRKTTEVIATSLATENTYGVDLRFLAMKKVDSSIIANFINTNTVDLRLNAETASTRHRDASVQGTFNSGKFRLTPKVDYSFDQSYTSAMLSGETTTVTPSLLARADMNLPKGLQLPFMSKPLMFTNRVVWTTTLSFAVKRSQITQADNTNLLSLSTNADYEISKNLRVALNGGLQRLWHKYLPEEEYVSFQAGTTMTLQF